MHRRETIKSIAAYAGWMRTIGVFGLASGGLMACKPSAPAFHGVDITGAEYARNFSLKDADGRVRTMADFAGRVVSIFFGFVQCPDVCPTALAELAQVKRLLGADGAKLQGVFVTVDPDRDTPEVLKAYIGSFDGDFVALRPDTADELANVTRHFKIYFSKVPGQTPTSYTVDHSAGSYLFDTQGRVLLYSRYGSGAEAIAADVRRLLAEKA